MLGAYCRHTHLCAIPHHRSGVERPTLAGDAAAANAADANANAANAVVALAITVKLRVESFHHGEEHGEKDQAHARVVRAPRRRLEMGAEAVVNAKV